MGAAKTVVMGGLAEADRRGGGVAQQGQVKYLHAVVGRLADDECMVGVSLDVAPGGTKGPVSGQFAQVDRVGRVTDVDEGGAEDATYNGVFLARLRVSPAPDVVGGAIAERPRPPMPPVSRDSPASFSVSRGKE